MESLDEAMEPLFGSDKGRSVSRNSMDQLDMVNLQLKLERAAKVKLERERLEAELISVDEAKREVRAAMFEIRKDMSGLGSSLRRRCELLDGPRYRSVGHSLSSGTRGGVREGCTDNERRGSRVTRAQIAKYLQNEQCIAKK